MVAAGRSRKPDPLEGLVARVCWCESMHVKATKHGARLPCERSPTAIQLQHLVVTHTSSAACSESGCLGQIACPLRAH